MMNSQLKFKPGQIRGLRLRLSLQRSGELNPAVRQEVLRRQVQSTRFKVEFKGFITGQNISAGPRFPGCNSLKPTTQRCVCKERQPCPQLPFQRHQAENKHLDMSKQQVDTPWGFQRNRKWTIISIYPSLSERPCCAGPHTRRCILLHPAALGHGFPALPGHPPASWCIFHLPWVFCCLFSTPQLQPCSAHSAEWLFGFLWLAGPSGLLWKGLAGLKVTKCTEDIKNDMWHTGDRRGGVVQKQRTL